MQSKMQFLTVSRPSFSNAEYLEKYLKQEEQAVTVNLLAVNKLTCVQQFTDL